MLRGLLLLSVTASSGALRGSHIAPFRRLVTTNMSDEVAKAQVHRGSVVVSRVKLVAAIYD
jgi:hypothetical protein